MYDKKSMQRLTAITRDTSSNRIHHKVNDCFKSTWVKINHYFMVDRQIDTRFNVVPYHHNPCQLPTQQVSVPGMPCGIWSVRK